jgi:uncharacterized protein YdeI (YjbR/CyaY-like superfamily)
MDPKPDDPILPFATSADFERWLAKHHRKAAVVWIKYAKKASGEPSITIAEAVEVALCYGWIDGQSKSLDERSYLQRFTPRRAASIWSKINRDRVARLIEDGRMRPAGLAEVDRAKADGRWDAAYDSPRTAVVPDDLSRALDRSPTAKAAFAKLDATNRYAILHRLQIAKQPQTRARRVETFVTMLEASKQPHPVKRKAEAASAKRKAAPVKRKGAATKAPAPKRALARARG